MANPLTPQQELEKVLELEQQRAAAGLPADPGLSTQRARWLEWTGHYDEAISACNEAASIYEELGEMVDPLVDEILSLIYCRKSQYELSLGFFEEAVRKYDERGQPHSPSLYGNVGSTYTMMGHFEKALWAFSKAEQLHLEQGQQVFPGIMLNTAAVNLSIGRYAEAEQQLNSALKMYHAQGVPVWPGVHVELSEIHYLRGEYEQALAQLQLARQANLENGIKLPPQIPSQESNVLGKLGRLEEAMEASREAERICTEGGLEPNWYFYFVRAGIHRAMGNSAQAIRDLSQAISHCVKHGVEEPAFLLETMQDWLAPPSEDMLLQQIASQPGAVQPIPDTEKKHDAFICYRREPSLANSMLLQTHLEIKQKSVFRDQHSLKRGHFAEELRQAVRETRHMIVLLTPEFFTRCSDGADVVRQEIATALHCGTHIIPVMMEGFSWPKPEELPEDIRSISGINAMSWSNEFFTAFVDKLVSWME